MRPFMTNSITSPTLTFPFSRDTANNLTLQGPLRKKHLSTMKYGHKISLKSSLRVMKTQMTYIPTSKTVSQVRKTSFPILSIIKTKRNKPMNVQAIMTGSLGS
jgi:hypothetical protein